MADSEQDFADRAENDNLKTDKLFILKKWNAVAMWSWDVECDTCAICRVQVMGVNLTRIAILAEYSCISSIEFLPRRFDKRITPLSDTQ
ncbi:unnamed protein product [Heterotrigona itama]|uniref:Uncharacterized protein n=1 Tax=Heterotrigona itama TaxID=395501 RepID=A0A6V7HDT2_9HYME|nr:unnamed protein product [Heterotrigona itama]